MTWKKQLRSQIKREHARAAREHLAQLREQIKHARAAHKGAKLEAVERCKRDRLAVRVRLQTKRASILKKLAAISAQQRDNARKVCHAGLTRAKSHKTTVEQKRAALVAEKKYRRELRAIAKANRDALKEHRASARERRSESDDEVLQNIPEDYASLWQRVKGGIKGSPRMSRTEAFMQYARKSARAFGIARRCNRAHGAAARSERARGAKRARRGPDADAYAVPF